MQLWLLLYLFLITFVVQPGMTTRLCPPPLAVENFTATVDGQLFLKWDINSSDLNKTLKYKFTLVDPTTKEKINLIKIEFDKNMKNKAILKARLTNCHWYVASILAEDSCGEGPVTKVNFTWMKEVDKPTYYKLKNIEESTAISVSFVPINLDNYKECKVIYTIVYEDITNKIKREISNLDVNKLPYHLTNLAGNAVIDVSVRILVRAYSSQRGSNIFDKITTGFGTIPGPVQNLTSDYQNGKVLLNWDLPNKNEYNPAKEYFIMYNSKNIGKTEMLYYNFSQKDCGKLSTSVVSANKQGNGTFVNASVEFPQPSTLLTPNNVHLTELTKEAGFLIKFDVVNLDPKYEACTVSYEVRYKKKSDENNWTVVNFDKAGINNKVTVYESGVEVQVQVRAVTGTNKDIFSAYSEIQNVAIAKDTKPCAIPNSVSELNVVKSFETLILKWKRPSNVHREQELKYTVTVLDTVSTKTVAMNFTINEDSSSNTIIAKGSALDIPCRKYQVTVFAVAFCAAGSKENKTFNWVPSIETPKEVKLAIIDKTTAINVTYTVPPASSYGDCEFKMAIEHWPNSNLKAKTLTKIDKVIAKNYTVTGLKAQTKYSFLVYALAAIGDMEINKTSQIKSIETGAGTAPGAVIALKAEYREEFVYLTWNAPINAAYNPVDNYLIYSSHKKHYSTNQTQLTVRQGQCQQITYTVTAKNTQGNGPDTNVSIETGVTLIPTPKNVKVSALKTGGGFTVRYAADTDESRAFCDIKFSLEVTDLDNNLLQKIELNNTNSEFIIPIDKEDVDVYVRLREVINLSVKQYSEYTKKYEIHIGNKSVITTKSQDVSTTTSADITNTTTAVPASATTFLISKFCFLITGFTLLLGH